MRCDADTLPPVDWLHRVHEAFAAEPRLTALTGSGYFYDLPTVGGHLAGSSTCGVLLGHAGRDGQRPSVGIQHVDSRQRMAGGQPPGAPGRRAGARRHRPELPAREHRSCAVRPRLLVGVSGRTFESASALRRRFRWAWHTLAVNWATSPPWERWAARTSVGGAVADDGSTRRRRRHCRCPPEPSCRPALS
ncbi:hypothetical protein NKG05_25860 [Oerskovia sp. M15]